MTDRKHNAPSAAMMALRLAGAQLGVDSKLPDNEAERVHRLAILVEGNRDWQLAIAMMLPGLPSEIDWVKAADWLRIEALDIERAAADPTDPFQGLPTS